MECKDCENYKPKEDKKLKEIQELCFEYCCSMDCRKCTIPEPHDYDNCPLRRVGLGHWL